MRYIYLFFFGGSTAVRPVFRGRHPTRPISVTPKAMIGAARRHRLLAGDSLLAAADQERKSEPGDSDNPALASAQASTRSGSSLRSGSSAPDWSALAGILFSLNNGVNWIEGFQMLLLVFGVIMIGLGTAFSTIVEFIDRRSDGPAVQCW